MASNQLKFSMVLEAVTAGFNTALKQAGANYATVTAGVVRDSSAMQRSTTSAAADLSKVFQARDAGATTAALKQVTKELNATSNGATVTAEQMKQVGEAGKLATKALVGEVRTARAELALLRATKATPADIDVATTRVRALKAAVAESQAEFGRFQTAASAAMQRAAAETQKATGKAQEAGRAIYSALNIRTDGAIRTEIAALSSQLDKFRVSAGVPAAELSRVTVAARDRIAELRGELAGVGPVAQSSAGGVSVLGARLLAMAGATAGLAAVQAGLRGIANTAIETERVMKQLEFATGSAEQAVKEYEFLRKTAKDLGLDLATLGRDYGQLTAATKGTNLEGEQTRVLFTGISQAAAALGLSAENTSGVITALSQIASKGKVSMEELRGQLGERLPGAFALAARSMGVTTAELEKLVANGIDASVFLKAFGPALVETFSPIAANNVNTLQGKINLLRNEFRELQTDLAKGGVGAGLATLFGTLTSGVEKIREALKAVDPATIAATEQAISQLFNAVTNIVGTLVGAAGDLFAQLESLAELVTGVVGAFVGVDVASDKVSFLTRTLQGLSVVLGLVSDGVSAISIAFTAATGVAQAFFANIARGLSVVTFGDLSAQLRELALTLDNEAAGSFDKAQEAALDFRSKAKEALDATTVAATATGAAVAKEVGEGAAKAAESVGAVGAAAQNTAGTIKLSSIEGAEAIVGIAKAGHDVTDALKALAAEAGVQLPTAARSAGQMAGALTEVGSKVTEVGRLIASELPGAIAKLNAADLETFRVVFTGSMEAAGASVTQLQDTAQVFATQSAKLIGVDLVESLKKPGVEFAQMSVTLDGLVGSMDTLKTAGVDANKLIADSLDALLAKARNPAEVTLLIEKWTQLGAQGKVTGDALVGGLDAAKARLDSMTPGINSLAEAFKTLGIASAAEASKLAKDYEKAFFMIEASGKASLSQVQEAFVKYASAAIAANDGVASEWIKGKAAALGLETAVDAAGKATVKAMSAGAEASSGLVTGINKATEAVKEYVGWAERMKERNDAVKSSLQTDGNGFAADAKGNTVVAGGALTTLTGIKSFLTQAGLSDDIAKQVALEFSDGKGAIPYFSNPGQMKYGGATSTISEALLKAAERYTFAGTGIGGTAAGVGAPQKSSGAGSQSSSYESGSNGKTVFEFKGSDGKTVTAQSNSGTSAADLMKILKDAGASASISSMA